MDGGIWCTWIFIRTCNCFRNYFSYFNNNWLSNSIISNNSLGDNDIGFIAIGCVVRGETSHYDIVANESAAGLTQLSISKNIIVTNSILTVENKQQAKPKGSNKVSYKEKYEYEQLEKDIENLETTKKELEEDLLQEGLSFQDINQKSEKLGKIIQELDNKIMRWLELDELV